MVSEEIKETVYIAISCIIAAAVLGLCAFVMGLRSDFAATYNEQQASKIATESYEKFAGYNDKVIYGDELIALIREFWGENISIYIDTLYFIADDGTNVPYLGVVNFDKCTVSDGIYIDRKLMDDIRNSRINGNNKLSSDDRYRVYYDIEDLSDIRAGNPIEIDGKKVLGLSRKEAYYVYVVTGLYSEEDIVKSSYDDKTIYSDVTGIIVRNITTYAEKKHFDVESDYESENVNHLISEVKLYSDDNNKELLNYLRNIT